MSTNYPSELSESMNLLAEQSRLAAAVPLMPFDLRQWLDVTLPNSLRTTKRKRSLDETEILWLSVVLSIFRNASIRDLSVMLGIRVVEAMILNGLMPPKKLRASYDRAVKIKMSNYPRNRGKRTVEAKEKSKNNPRVKP